jgi:hypothetical protein
MAFRAAPWRAPDDFLTLKAAKRFLLVREVRKDGVKVGEAQDFLSSIAQIDGSQVCIILPRGKDGSNQLPDAGAIEVRYVAKIQQDALSTVSKEIAEQFVHGLTFDQRESAAHVHDRDVSHLPGTGTKAQFILLRFESVILSYAASFPKCPVKPKS